MMETPKYLQVIHYIESLIESSKAHTLIPSERTLSDTLMISRMTIRKAIEMMVSQGKLYRIQHKGTFVSEHKLFKVYNTMSGFTDEVNATGGHVSTDVLIFEIMKAPEEILYKLNLSEDALVYHIKRLRKKDDIPMILEDAYMPYDICDLSLDDAKHSIYRALRKKLSVAMASSIQEIKAVLVDLELPDIFVWR
jgi:DNA-binding GntR family transcriptional regulator